MRRWLGLGALLLGALYAASPYYTLWSLKRAIEQKDTFTLERLVDWPRIREKVRSDMHSVATKLFADDGGIGAGLATLMMPSFIAAVVDGSVTPAGLTRDAGESGSPLNPKNMNVTYAFFVGLTGFRVDLTSKPAEGDDPIPVSSLMQFEGSGWRVTNVNLPLDQILEKAKEAAGALNPKQPNQ
jgi:hypothetical protein